MATLNTYVLLQDVEGGTLLYNSINGAMCLVPVEKNNLSAYWEKLDKEDFRFFIDNLYMEYGPANERVSDIVHSIKNQIKYSNRYASFTIHLNYNCNLMCPYCYQNDIAAKKVMSPEVELELYGFFEKVKTSNNLAKIDIAFIGGEPLLNLELMLRIMQKASVIFRDVDVNYSIVSNGTLFTKEVVRRIKNIQFSSIQITLDGSRDIHNALRMYKNHTGTYDDILENLTLLQNDHLPVQINCNLNANSYRQVDSLFEELTKRQIFFPVFFSLVFECESSHQKRKFAILSEHKTMWLDAHKIAAEYGHKYPPFYRLSYMVCGVEKVNDFNISPSGKIYKCLSGMEKEEFFLADLRDYGNTRYYNRLSNFIEYNNLKEKCPRCKFVVFCGGWCRYAKRIHGEYCPYEELESNDLCLLDYACQE